jgi:hypothetical protein
MVGEIWTQHGLPVPSSPARPWIIEHALNPPGYAAQVRTATDLLAGTGRFISGIVGTIRNASAADSEGADTEPPNFEIRTGTGSVEVTLVDGVEDLIGSLTDGIFTSRLVSSAKVELRRNGESVEVWTLDGRQDGTPILIGSVPTEEASRYLPLLRAAERVDQALMCPTVRMEGPDGRWHLYVKFPLTSPG